MTTIEFNPENFQTPEEGTARYILGGVKLSSVKNDADWRIFGKVDRSPETVEITFSDTDSARAFALATRTHMAGCSKESFLAEMESKRNWIVKDREIRARLVELNFFKQIIGKIDLVKGSCRAYLYLNNRIFPSGVEVSLNKEETTTFIHLLAEASLHFANHEDAELRTLTNQIVVERMFKHYFPLESESHLPRRLIMGLE